MLTQPKKGQLILPNYIHKLAIKRATAFLERNSPIALPQSVSVQVFILKYEEEENAALLLHLL